MADNTRRLARMLAGLDKRMSAQERSAQSAFRSVESGTVTVNDEDGNAIAEVGLLADGSFGAVDLIVHTPEPPTDPDGYSTVNGIGVAWDGGYITEQPVGVTIAYVGVHLNQDPDDVDWEPSLETEAGQITPGGGSVLLPADAGVETAVHLVTVTAAGKWSDPTDPILVTPAYLFDSTVLDGLLDDLNTALSDLQTELDAVLPITETKIADDAITTPKIAANAVTASEIAAGAVTALKIAAATITAHEIAAGAITATEIATGAITSTKIAATAIDGKVITGALVQSDAAATDGVKMSTTGLKAYGLPGVLIDAFHTGFHLDMAIDSSGYIYLVENYQITSDKSRIRKFDSVYGDQISTGGFPAGPVRGYTTGICLDATNNVYTCGFTRAFLPVIRKWVAGVEQVSGGWPIYEAALPPNSFKDVAVDAAGAVYVLDQDAKLVRKYSSAGVAGITWSTTGVPAAIQVRGSTVYVLDATNKLVRTWSLTGTGAASFSTTDSPVRMFVNPTSGDVWVTTVVPVPPYSADYFLRRFNSAGTLLSTWELNDKDVEGGLVLDSGGLIYVGETRSNTVKVHSPLGNLESVTIDSADGSVAIAQLHVDGDLDAGLIYTQGIAAPPGRSMAIKNLVTPNDSTDAANKAYVDGLTHTEYSDVITATSPFTNTVTLTRVGDFVIASGAFGRASGSSSSFVVAGQVPDGFKPTTLVNDGGVIWFTTLTYGIQIDTAGVVTIRMAGANANSMTFSAIWKTADDLP